MGCDPTNEPWDPFWESGKLVPHPCRQLSDNTNPQMVQNHGQPVPTTTGHHQTDSIERLPLLCALPRIVLDLLRLSDESITGNSTSTMLLHPTVGFRLPPTH